MDSLLIAVPALGCALMMVPMIWFMSRGMKQDGQPSSGRLSPPPAARDPEVAELQAEVDRLRAEMRGQDPGTAREPDQSAPEVTELSRWSGPPGG